MKTDTSYTPGPWSTGCCMTNVEMRPKGWNSSILIADCHVQKGRIPESSDERVANARLIAAAPDMVQALMECLTIVDAHRRVTLGDGDICAANVRRVLKQSLGE